MLRKSNLIIFLFFIFFSRNIYGDIAFITNQESDKVDVIDLVKKKKVFQFNVGKKPAGITIDSTKKIIYVSNPESHNISKIDFKSKNHKFLYGGKSPMSLFYSTSKELLFFSNWYENKVSVVDTEQNIIIKELKVGKSPAGIYI